MNLAHLFRVPDPSGHGHLVDAQNDQIGNQRRAKIDENFRPTFVAHFLKSFAKRRSHIATLAQFRKDETFFRRARRPETLKLATNARKERNATRPRFGVFADMKIAGFEVETLKRQIFNFRRHTQPGEPSQRDGETKFRVLRFG
ncbi:MAG: hypothetical protein J6K20_06175 [Thermoguttaceae bacterium]|nr:hypothetical protein [Thermoguttaceae bacterium]